MTCDSCFSDMTEVSPGKFKCQCGYMFIKLDTFKRNQAVLVNNRVAAHTSRKSSILDDLNLFSQAFTN